jgi:chromosome segregation ATPase
LDAISFVLGVSSNDLRGKQVTDFIYRFVEGSTPQKLRCYVKLNFVNGKNKRTSFKRMISSNNASFSYYLDDKPTAWANYQKALHDINLFPKLKNFLVFQGTAARLFYYSILFFHFISSSLFFFFAFFFLSTYV